MTDSFKREIERLLDEPGELPEAGQASDRLRSRLTATLSEGLGSVSSSDVDTGDAASIAAFIDGQLTGAARDEFVAALAQRPSLRADVESAAELVSSVSENPLTVPKDLLARAGAQFAPAAPRQAESRSRWSFSLSALLPRQRMALAMVAALALILTVPAGLMIGSRLGGPGGGEPELSAVPEPDVAAQQQACKDKANAAKAEKSKTAVPAPKETSDGSKPKDPCDQFAPNGEKNK
jgi:anti-sigma factor RsiW